MPEYSIQLSRNAEKTLDKMSDSVAMPLLTAISALKTEPRPHGYKKLTNRNGYRIRVGNYRIIYEIEDRHLLITVIALGHRKDIYR